MSVQRGMLYAVFGFSEHGQGVHGETMSTDHGVVVGITNGLPNRTTNRGATVVHGFSRSGEGVHGESNSDTLAAVTGMNVDPDGRRVGPDGEA